MTKDELLSQLTNAKNNYVLGLAAISLFGSSEAYPILEKSRTNFGQYNVEFSQVASLLQIQQDRDIAIKEFLTSQIRALIKESFELIKDYCDETGQEINLKSELWYQFARMIRNCLSHNFKFEFNNYDKTLLPVTWKNKTITAGMDGQHLKLDFFGYVETWELFVMYQDFVVRRVV
jgi:DNA-directed RNA polymerase subunit L